MPSNLKKATARFANRSGEPASPEMVDRSEGSGEPGAPGGSEKPKRARKAKKFVPLPPGDVDLLDIPQTETAVHGSRATVYRLIASGHLKKVKVRGATRITRGSIQEYRRSIGAIA